MFLRYFLLIGTLLGLTGCAHHSQMQAAVPSQPLKKDIQVPAFTRVVIHGKLNVNVHTGYSQAKVLLHGDPRDLAPMKVQVVNGVLHVTEPKKYPRFGGVQVDINTRYLNAFEYHGAGVVTATGLRSHLLDLVIDNKGRTIVSGYRLGLRSLYVSGGGYTEVSGINSPSLQLKIAGGSQVKLSGMANLTKLNLKDKKGNGRVSFYWVKSDTLIVRGGGKSYIQLAGVVNKLDLELWNEARFNGRYLRVDRAFVKTHHKSVAEMSAVKRQHTLAMDTSDIHFYNLSTLRTDYMADQGAVLDMRDHGTPFEQEYTQYNK